MIEMKRTAGDQATILIVDDDAIIRKMLARVIRPLLAGVRPSWGQNDD